LISAFEPAPCGLDGDRRAEGDRRRTPKELDSKGRTFLSREEWRRSRQGKKVLTPLLRHRRSRLQPAFGQINPSKRTFGALDLDSDGIKENVASQVVGKFAATDFKTNLDGRGK
jgi:hypothetical protein